LAGAKSYINSDRQTQCKFSPKETTGAINVIFAFKFPKMGGFQTNPKFHMLKANFLPIRTFSDKLKVRRGRIGAIASLPSAAMPVTRVAV